MTQLFSGSTNKLSTKKPLPFILPIVFILKTPENANMSQSINIVACKPRRKNMLQTHDNSVVVWGRLLPA